jgi:hypothetical protein
MSVRGPRLFLHVVLLFAAFSLLACAGVPLDSSIRFVNKSGLPDAVLEGYWAKAQENLATKSFPLNTMQHNIWGTPLEIHDPDPRARDVNPDGLHVIVRTDNNGEFFRCDGIAQARGCEGGNIVEFAKNYPQVLEYEFENVILSRLGYQTSR